jgi:ATP-dependent helicase YprA (DUF1998 family)
VDPQIVQGKFGTSVQQTQKRAALVARYTGQESKETREAIAKSPPDILLTNFMMLELLLTLQEHSRSSPTVRV